MVHVKGFCHLYPLELVDLVAWQRHYKREDVVGMSVLKSRHFHKKSDYRKYLEAVNQRRVPKLIGRYPKPLPTGWSLRTMSLNHPEKLHPLNKWKKQGNSLSIDLGSLEGLCSQFSKLSIIDKIDALIDDDWGVKGPTELACERQVGLLF